VQRIQHLTEIFAGERPLAQNFLGALANRNEDNPRIRRRAALRPVTKTRVQRAVFKPLQKIKRRRAAVAQKCKKLDGERRQRDSQADEERNSVLPP
jgi:hypothetical protein